MSDKAIFEPLPPAGRGEPISDEEAEELVEFFCGKQEGYGEPPLYGGDAMPTEEEIDDAQDNADQGDPKGS